MTLDLPHVGLCHALIWIVIDFYMQVPCKRKVLVGNWRLRIRVTSEIWPDVYQELIVGVEVGEAFLIGLATCGQDGRIKSFLPRLAAVVFEQHSLQMASRIYQYLRINHVSNFSWKAKKGS